ncbi:MAG: hypothetical protein EBE86_026755 [Hormoscilla sp. GUM202]|nr:hypothetical protein [Hormoscilla sp. GUM202]
MSTEKIKRQFAEHVKLRGYDDQYIDRQEEREIMEFAVNQGLTVDEGLAILVRVCQERNYTLERDIETRAFEMLTQFATNDGKIDKKEFFDAVGIMQNMSKGKLSEVQCQKKAKQIVLDNNWQIKTGLFGGKPDWFKKI